MGEQEVKRDDDQQVFEEFQNMIRDAKLEQNFGESWINFINFFSSAVSVEM